MGRGVGEGSGGGGSVGFSAGCTWGVEVGGGKRVGRPGKGSGQATLSLKHETLQW